MTREPPLDPFEREIRDALADEPAEPAPERLIARVASIPHEVRPGLPRGARAPVGLGAGRRSAVRLGLSAAAAGLVLLVAGAVLLGGLTPVAPVGGPPSSVGLTDRVSSLSRIVERLRTVIRELGDRREATIDAVGPTGGPVPAGFQPVSVTFVSESEGWLLGAAPCAGAPCPAAIVRTTDGGRTWASIPAPDASIMPGGPEGGSTGVSGLRFADALNGWAFGPDLWATHDGGSTWLQVTRSWRPEVGVVSRVSALEATAGEVQVAFFDTAASALRIATSPVDRDAWTSSAIAIPVGAGPVPHAQLVLHGTAGWLVEVDRQVVGGARLVAGDWQAWRPPCADLAGPAVLAAASEWDLVAACDEGLWSTPKGVHLWVSTDAGASFIEAATRPPVFSVDGVGAPSPSSVIVAGSLSGVGSALVASFDGGMSWTGAYVLAGAGTFSDLAFTTASHGVAITTSLGEATVGEGHLIMTRDGGRTWSTVPIAGP